MSLALSLRATAAAAPLPRALGRCAFASTSHTATPASSTVSRSVAKSPANVQERAGRSGASEREHSSLRAAPRETRQGRAQPQGHLKANGAARRRESPSCLSRRTSRHHQRRSVTRSSARRAWLLFQGGSEHAPHTPLAVLEPSFLWEGRATLPEQERLRRLAPEQRPARLRRGRYCSRPAAVRSGSGGRPLHGAARRRRHRCRRRSRGCRRRRRAWSRVWQLV